DKPIDIQVTSDGLRVTLFDRAKRPLFVKDTTEFTEWGQFILQSLAWTIDRHGFHVTIDGHSRKGVVAQPNYDEWDLSSAQANTRRRTLVHYAVTPSLSERVTGYADTKPMAGKNPESESNQRISLALTLSAKPKLKDGTLVENPAEKPAEKPAERP